jgi:hypothetical protein
MGRCGQILGGEWPASMSASAMYATLLGAPLAGPESGSDCMTGYPDRTRKWSNVRMADDPAQTRKCAGPTASDWRCIT